jgi:glutaredoxin 3
MADVTVYTTEPCPYCSRVKQLLAKRGVEYQEINLARDADGRTELAERTGMLTFPQVLVGDVVVGGFDQTVIADRSGRLAELLAEADEAEAA